MALGIGTLGIGTLGIGTLGKMTLDRMALRRMTLGIVIPARITHKRIALGIVRLVR